MLIHSSIAVDASSSFCTTSCGVQQDPSCCTHCRIVSDVGLEPVPNTAAGVSASALVPWPYTALTLSPVVITLAAIMPTA